MKNLFPSRLEAIMVLPLQLPSQNIDPLSFNILGLTIVERFFRALEKSGVEHVTCLTKGNTAQLKELLEKSAPWAISFSFVENKNLKHVLTSYHLLPPSEGLLFFAEPIMIDPKLIERMVEKGKRIPDQTLATKGKEIVYWGTDLLEKFTPEHLLSCENNLYKNRSTWFLGHQLLCHPMRDFSDVRKVERYLIRNLTKPNDGWVSRHLNRPISTLFSRILARTHITPNQVTLALVLPSLVTGYALAQGGYWGFLIGGSLFHLTSILDGVDGELARLKYKSSLYGKWLDFMCDNLAYLVALIGFLIGLYRDGISPFERVASLTALLLTICMMASIILYYKRFNKDGKLLTVEYGFREGTGWFDRLMQWAELLGKREWFALIFFSLSIFGKLEWALVYVCLVAAGVLLFSFEAHARAKKMRRAEC